MYVRVEKRPMKRKSKGQPKRIETDIVSFSFNGVADQYASFHYSAERFDRPLKDIYKFVLCHSYREGGKQKKRQYVVTSINYYEALEDYFSMYDCLVNDYREGRQETLFKFLENVGGTIDEAVDLLEKEFEKIQKKILKEYQQTEEYKTDKANDAIIKKHRKKEKEFDAIYGDGNYKRCYNVFGELWNQEKLEQLKAQHEAQERYKKEYSSYSSGWGSNYNSHSYSNTISKPAAYSQDEKDMLRIIYKSLAKTFHPDKPTGDETIMKFITSKLKVDWGI